MHSESGEPLFDQSSHYYLLDHFFVRFRNLALRISCDGSSTNNRLAYEGAVMGCRVFAERRIRGGNAT